MCTARKEAQDASERFEQEKSKNDELMEQIETLERDLLAFRKDFVKTEGQVSA